MTTRSDAYDRRQREAGWKRVMVRLRPWHRELLVDLTAIYGSQETALRLAIEALWRETKANEKYLPDRNEAA